MDDVFAQWAAFLDTPAGWRYLAKRVRAGAKAVTRETFALERWLAARAPFNHSEVKDAD